MPARAYQCRTCHQWFLPPSSGYVCMCLPHRDCPCHCGTTALTPTSYGNGEPYDGGLFGRVQVGEGKMAEGCLTQ